MRAGLRGRNHSRPRSRHQRYGLGFSQYEVLWRVLESEPGYGHVFEDGTRFRQRANEILGRRMQRIRSWETDSPVYYHPALWLLRPPGRGLVGVPILEHFTTR